MHVSPLLLLGVAGIGLSTGTAVGVVTHRVASSLGSTGLTPSEEERHRVIVRGSLSAGTTTRYRHATGHWDTYLGTLRSDIHPGRLMQNLATDAQRSMRLVLFIGYLHEAVGLMGAATSPAINALRILLVENGHSYFDSEGVKAARKAAQPSARAQTAQLMRAEESRFLPLTLSMVEKLRALFWPVGDGLRASDHKGLDSAAIWIAVGLGCEGGLRISNLASTSRNGGESDYRLSCNQVTFTVLDLADGSYSTHHPGPAMREALQNILFKVELATFRFISSKTKRPVRLSLDSVTGSALLEDLTEWVLCSRLEETDAITTRVDDRGIRRQLQSRDVAQAIKLTAGSLHLDPARYSTKSMRCFFATMCAEMSVDPETRNVMGGWAAGSRVPDMYYSHAMTAGILSRARAEASGSETD